MTAETSERQPRSSRTDAAGRERPFTWMLVVVGDDEASLAAVQVAGELAARLHADVLAVRVAVAEVPCFGPSPEACGLGDLGAALAQAVSQLRRAGVRCRGERWRTQSHRVVHALLRAADEYDAALLVIRSRRHSGAREMDQSDAEALKTCCADPYASDWVRLLLGESLHPGGLDLTTRLGRLLGLDERSRVLDVAAGQGASALHLARTFGCQVVGADYAAGNVELATRVARGVQLNSLVTFVQGDAERLAQPDESFDAVVCECSYCTFPDKAAAAREFARVLRRGGRVGLSDLVRNGPLPPELEGPLAHISCLADARPIAEYRQHLDDAGLTVEHVEDHSQALGEMVETIRTRLLRTTLLTRLRQIDPGGIDIGQARQMARAALGAVRDGTLGYELFVATKRSGPHPPRRHSRPTAATG